MDYDKYMMRTDSGDAKDLYTRMVKLLREAEQFNMSAMVVMQSLGYNGFKRWHRYRSRQFHECAIKLMNEAFDRYHEVVKPEQSTLAYSPANMNGHLLSWKDKLEGHMHELCGLAHEYFMLNGTQGKAVKHALHAMSRDYEKVCRYYERFMEGDWLAHDMHVVDDMIHYKFKKKEEAHGY